jgi:hypothetical protein
MIAVLALTGTALGQPTAQIYLETDAPGGIVSAGQSVHMRVMVDWTGGVQFAGALFRVDLEGNAGQASNFASIFPPIFFRVGTVTGGSVRNIDLATVAPFHLGGFFVPPFNEPTLPLVEYDWVAPTLPHGSTIDLTMDNDGLRQGAFIFTTPGSAAWAVADTTFVPYTFTIAPAPASAAVGLAGAAFVGRRRR